MTSHDPCCWLPPELRGRFALGSALGSGAGGVVYGAADRLLGREVALKMLRPANETERRRARREVAALMALDLPGVVRLLDQVELDDGVLLVMERVEGRPFPAVERRSWEALVPPTVVLLRALAGVHAAGLVHRDLKPDNALVEPGGRVVLMDFGLAVGSMVGDRVTRSGAVVGTPRYLAPEQLSGDAVDGRADLYALGVMLYEHLSGEPPHPAARLSELWVSRLTRDAPSLGQRRPDLPEQAVRVVDRLLARAPEARYPSAAALLDALCGREAPRCPWVGDRGWLNQAAARLVDGRPFRIAGPPGSGRSRALDELKVRLGPRAELLPPGERPLSSLSRGRPLVLESAACVDQWIAAEIHSMRAEGRVPLVDLDCDPWTREAMLAAGMGALIVEGEADWTFRPLDTSELVTLFAPGGAFLHIAEDAAAELRRRSGGLPARAVAELGRWIAEGLAHWDGDRLALGRADLQRIAARPLLPVAEAVGQPLPPHLDALYAASALGWPEADVASLALALALPRWEVELGLARLQQLGALDQGRPRWPCDALARDPEGRCTLHARLASALRPGAPGRLRHLLAAGDAEPAREEALVVADQALVDGRTERAVLALRAGVRLCQAEGRDERPLLDALIPALLVRFDAVSQRMLDYELARATCDVESLAALARGWRLVQSGAAREALALFDGLGPLPLAAQRARLAGRAAAAQLLPVHEHEATVRAMIAAIPEADPMSAQARGWLGLLAYRQRRFHEAAALHRSAAQARAGAGRLASLLNAANAAMEAGELDEARALAGEAQEAAATLRDAFSEARAAVIARLCAHRARVVATTDPALVDAVASLGVPWLEGTIAAAEAALALRLGRVEDCRALAIRATRSFERAGLPSGRLYARAIAVAAGEGSLDEAEALVDEASRCSLPEVALDVLALMSGQVAPRKEAVRTARAMADTLERSSWGMARGVYTVEEALGRLGVEV